MISYIPFDPNLVLGLGSKNEFIIFLHSTDIVS